MDRVSLQDEDGLDVRLPSVTAQTFAPCVPCVSREWEVGYEDAPHVCRQSDSEGDVVQWYVEA